MDAIWDRASCIHEKQRVYHSNVVREHVFAFLSLWYGNVWFCVEQPTAVMRVAIFRYAKTPSVRQMRSC